MIRPILSNEALRDEIDRTALEVSSSDLVIWWLGQSGFLVQSEGKRILFDPYLSDSLTEKYDGTDKPHVRISDRVIDPDMLSGIDVVSSSHNHTDHLDALTLLPVLKNNPQAVFVIPEANRDFVTARLGYVPVGMVGIRDGQTITVGGTDWTGIASAHNTVERDARGLPLYMGYVVRVGRWTIYHSGDTLVYPGLAETLKPFAVDIAFLPINGHRPERRVAGNMDGREAASLASAIGARCVVPHHFHLFEFNSEEPDLFEACCSEQGQAFKTMRLGERWVLRG